MLARLFTAIILFIPTTTHAWWSFQHRIIAQIAEEELPDKLKTKLTSLLNQKAPPFDQTVTGKLKSFIDSSVWMDATKHPKLKDQFMCHFINVEVDLKRPRDFTTLYDRAVSESPRSSVSCTLWAAETLALHFEGEVSKEKAGIALRYLTHIVGDIHQPLHNVALKLKKGQTDLGGVRLLLDPPITIAAQKRGKETLTSLHTYWDALFGIFKQDGFKHMNEPSKQRRRLLSAAVAEAKQVKLPKDALKRQKIKDWIEESYHIALQIYQDLEFPGGLTPDKRKSVKIKLKNPKTYPKRFRDIGLQRLHLAGKRLAWLLKGLHEEKTGHAFLRRNFPRML